MYSAVFPKSFENDVKDIKKDNILYERLWKKITEIMENPEHYPIKRYNLKGKRAAHIGSYVVVFEIKDNEVIFWRFKHHDFAYD